jgi:hypothetical protein
VTTSSEHGEYMNEDETLDETFYIEFVVEGVLKVKESDKERVLTKLNKLFTKILEKENAIQISSNCNLVSEKSVILSMTPGAFDFEN